MQEQEKIFKIVAIGESSVGKTSLIRRYIYNHFSDEESATIGAVFVEKSLIVDKKRVRLQIWDTAGQEKFHAVAKIYYQKADAALLVYDITSADSFSTLQNWNEEVKVNTSKDILRVIVGTKLDLIEEEQVHPKTASDYAREAKALFHQTSAKANRGINELFENVCLELIKRENSKPEPLTNLSAKSSVLLGEPPAPKKSSCDC